MLDTRKYYKRLILCVLCLDTQLDVSPNKIGGTLIAFSGAIMSISKK